METPLITAETSNGKGTRDETFSLALIICTRNRPESLQRTLESLAAAERRGMDVRVVVVDNSGAGSNLHLPEALFRELPLRVVKEDLPGKGNALNRGLQECGGAELIAVLDDDITVDGNWFTGVRQITRRWPDKGFFTGSMRVAWPEKDVPEWAKNPMLASWAFSALASQSDRHIGFGHWASGNHFWFRAKLLPPNYRFTDDWLCEPPLMLDLAERGFGGVIGPDAIAWHHVQPELLRGDVLRDRAMRVGRCFARARLKPYRRSVKQARLFKRYPIASRLFCRLNAARWSLAYWLARFSFTPQTRLLLELRILQKEAVYREYTRVCRECADYSIRLPWCR